MSEVAANIQAELSDKGSKLAVLRGLTESAGWLTIKAVAEAQRQSRINIVGEAPLQSFSGVLPQEYMKGEAAGIGLILTLPYTMMDSLQQDIDVLESQLTTENQNETETLPDGRSRVDSPEWSGE